MKVIIKDSGDVKKVSYGYAVNFLFPRGLAIPATNENLGKIERIKKEKEADKAKENKLKENKFNQLSGKKFIIKTKAGENGRLFGTITKKELAKTIKVDKKEIVLVKPIKKIGLYEIELKSGSFKTSVKLEVKKDK